MYELKRGRQKKHSPRLSLRRNTHGSIVGRHAEQEAAVSPQTGRPLHRPARTLPEQEDTGSTRSPRKPRSDALDGARRLQRAPRRRRVALCSPLSDAMSPHVERRPSWEPVQSCHGWTVHMNQLQRMIATENEMNDRAWR